MSDLANYLKGRKVLIVDPSTPSRLAVLKALIEIGVERKDIELVGTFDDAEADMNRRHPAIIISEFKLDKHVCFDLLSLQAKYIPNPQDKIFVMITKSSDESVVAEAAEEDIDAFLIKPYSYDSLIKYLKTAIDQKVNVSGYRKTVNEGKELLDADNVEPAKGKFSDAKGMDEKPTLACYYLGQSIERKESPEQALIEYRNGLKFNPIHYKCLVGEFEVLDKLKRNDEAYKAIQIIAQHFPISPKRLMKIFSLAVYTKNFADIEKYYEYFKAMDYRSEELTRFVLGGLLVCGKSCLSDGSFDQADKVFGKLAASGGRNPAVLKKIIDACLDKDQYAIAERYLRMFPIEAREDLEYLHMDFKVAYNQKVPAGTIVGKGQQLIEEGVNDPWVYEVVIQMLNDIRKTNTAEEVAYKAAQKFPEEKERFLAMIKAAS